MKHIQCLIHDKFAYRENRLTEGAVATVLHTPQEHVEHKNTYTRLLLENFSSTLCYYDGES